MKHDIKENLTNIIGSEKTDNHNEKVSEEKYCDRYLTIVKILEENNLIDNLVIAFRLIIFIKYYLMIN